MIMATIGLLTCKTKITLNLALGAYGDRCGMPKGIRGDA